MSSALSSEASISSPPVDMEGVLRALLTILCQENLENVLLNWKIENTQVYMVCLSDSVCSSLFKFCSYLL